MAYLHIDVDVSYHILWRQFSYY